MTKCGRRQRDRAVGLYVTYERNAADTIRELGYPQQGCAVDVVQGPTQVEVPPQTQLRGRPHGRVHRHARRLHGPVLG